MTSVINVALDTLLQALSLNTAWVSLRADSRFLPPAAIPLPPHGFLLGPVRNLPASLEQSDRYYLTRSPECHCQELLRTGRLNHAINVVECDRLRDAVKTDANNRGLRFHASMPLYSGDEAIGIMNFAMEDWQLLSAADLQLLSTSIELLRSALERAHLFDLSENQRHHLEQELELARLVQVSLLPKKLPKIPGFSLSAFWKPATEISGDFYGIYKLPDQQWGLVIADVCGKGASAALFMAMTYSLIRERVEKEQSPASLLTKINQSLCQQLPEVNFVTCFYAILNPLNNTLTYATAGHNPPIFRKASGEVGQLLRGSMALGVVKDAKYEDRVVSLESGDSLVIFTDGVTDAINSQDDMYELARFQAAVGSAAGKAAPLLKHLKNDLSTWVGETHQYDDITLLVLTRD